MRPAPYLRSRRKRGLDIVVAGLALTLASPVLLACAIAIRLETHGHPIYRQRRVGRAGAPFELWKLRTMVSGAETMGKGLAVDEGDDRITRLGSWLRRTSFDEVPNLINVVRGEMSVVGPRPTVQVQVDRYDEQQRHRLDALPGDHRLGAGPRPRLAPVARAHRARPLVRRARLPAPRPPDPRPHRPPGHHRLGPLPGRDRRLAGACRVLKTYGSRTKRTAIPRKAVHRCAGSSRRHNVGSRVTLKTIADVVGVSRTTVSNAYNRPDQLAPELRDRILQTARELRYAGPDAAARQLRSGRRDAVGLLLAAGLSSAFSDPAASLLLQGIARAAENAGLGLLVIPERGTGVHDAVVDAFCLYAMAADHPNVTAARERGLPLVVVDEPRLDGHAFVGVEDRRGARMAAEHLLTLGHTRFALLADRRSTHNLERLGGYRDALEGAAIDWRRVPRSERPADALDADPLPTAVIAATDQLAIAAIELARSRGLRVPEDISVVGFDDVPEAGPSNLTTVRQPLIEKGEIAGRMLTDRGGDGEVILPVELVVRGTTAPAVTA